MQKSFAVTERIRCSLHHCFQKTRRPREICGHALEKGLEEFLLLIKWFEIYLARASEHTPKNRCGVYPKMTSATDRFCEGLKSDLTIHSVRKNTLFFALFRTGWVSFAPSPQAARVWHLGGVATCDCGYPISQRSAKTTNLPDLRQSNSKLLGRRKRTQLPLNL